MSEFTKGPWITDGSNAVYSVRGDLVCRVTGPGSNPSVRADAVLIATTPDLLKFVEDWLADFTRAGTTDSPHEAEARALIAKATGEQ